MADSPEVVLIDGAIRATIVRCTANGLIVDAGHAIMFVTPDRVTSVE